MSSSQRRSTPHGPLTRRRRSTSARALASATLALLGSSCLTYHDRVSNALKDFEHGDFSKAVAQYSDTNVTGSAFLSGTEAGMAALTNGDWQTAHERLDRAAGIVEAIEDSPPITPETTTEAALALLLNEGFAEYEGEGYERVQLHCALAIAYLAQGDVEGVGVEARRANKLLENEEQLYEKKYQAGGLGHFVSALAYEMQGSYDNAFIDYRRMEEKGVGVDLAGRALVRLAKRLGYGEDLGELVQKYGEGDDVPADAASIIVIAGIGMGPRKIEKTLTIPLEHGVGQVSIPEFQPQPQPVSGVELRVGDASAPLHTTVVEDVTKVATDNLNDRIAWLTARSMLRGALKYELTRRLSSELGQHNGDTAEFFGLVVGSLLTIATERADLRSWQTLPNSWQVARMFVAPGAHDIGIAALGGDAVQLGKFELGAGETMFVFVRTLDTRVYAHAIGGKLSNAESATPAPAATTPSTPSTSEPL